MLFGGVFAAVAGILMLVQWSILLATGRVAELRTEPLAIALHLVVPW